MMKIQRQNTVQKKEQNAKRHRTKINDEIGQNQDRKKKEETIDLCTMRLSLRLQLPVGLLRCLLICFCLNTNFQFFVIFISYTQTYQNSTCSGEAMLPILFVTLILSTKFVAKKTDKRILLNVNNKKLLILIRFYRFVLFKYINKDNTNIRNRKLFSMFTSALFNVYNPNSDLYKPILIFFRQPKLPIIVSTKSS